MLLTGMHTISNLTCKSCDAPLGWVYIKASDPAQKYKEGASADPVHSFRVISRLNDLHTVGKYILEKVGRSRYIAIKSI